jgi:hypothetical protein
MNDNKMNRAELSRQKAVAVQQKQLNLDNERAETFYHKELINKIDYAAAVGRYDTVIHINANESQAYFDCLIVLLQNDGYTANYYDKEIQVSWFSKEYGYCVLMLQGHELLPWHALAPGSKVRVESALDAASTKRLIAAIERACFQVEQKRVTVEKVVIKWDNVGDLVILAFPPFEYSNVPFGRIVIKKADIPLNWKLYVLINRVRATRPVVGFLLMLIHKIFHAFSLLSI